MFKRALYPGDLFLILVNLVPLWGVWFGGWNATEIFMVYCLESVVIGLCNLLKLAMVTTVKKREVWNNNSQKSSLVSGLFFMLFFLIHYGIFVFIQLGIFLSVSGTQTTYGISNSFDFIIHFPRYLSTNSEWLLAIVTVSYGLLLLKDFVLNGAYKTASLGAIMFEPYARIFIQQFTVIAGSLFLSFGAGKIFISIFVCVKIFFDVLINYKRIIAIIAKKQELANRSQ